MRRKFLALFVSLIFVCVEPVQAQAIAKCTSSQSYVISSAQRQVSTAQIAVNAAQGYVRLATIGYNSSQSTLRTTNNNFNNLNKQLNAFLARESGANRVALLDLQIAVEKLNQQLPSAEHALALAQSKADQAQRYLDLQTQRLAASQDNLGRKQAELQRQQTKCSP